MEQELQSDHPDLNVEILGVNVSGEEAYNYLISAESTLPWLQDTASANVWTSWGVMWRDLRILDSANRLVAVVNLTSNDLSYPANYASVRQLFLQAAQEPDADTNGLPDDWETNYFGTNGVSANADPDRDGFDNFREFAFGSNPTVSISVPAPLRVSLLAGGSQPLLSIALRRRAGWVLDYIFEASPDLNQWTPVPPLSTSLRNLFDGTGTAEATCVFTNAVPGGACEFYRVRVARRTNVPPRLRRTAGGRSPAGAVARSARHVPGSARAVSKPSRSRQGTSKAGSIL